MVAGAKTDCIRRLLCYTPRSRPARPVGTTVIFNRLMSQHSSLRAVSAGSGAKRSVLKRFERVAILKTLGQWKEGDRITGLRKTKPPE